MKRFTIRVLDWKYGESGWNKYAEYQTDRKEELISEWRKALSSYEGNDYAVMDGLNIICSGAMDPDDIDVITHYLEVCGDDDGYPLALSEAIDIIKQEQGLNSLDLMFRPDCHCKGSQAAYEVARAAMTVLKVVYGMGDAIQFMKETEIRKDDSVSVERLVKAIKTVNASDVNEQVAVVEQEDTEASKSSADRHTGSTPVGDTTSYRKEF